MELATEEWEKAGFSSDDVEHQSERLNELADLIGLEVEEIIYLIYDYAVASGKGFVDALLEVMDNDTLLFDFYDRWNEEETVLKANDKGLSERKIYQLRGLPVGSRIDAYNACKSRAQGFKMFPLRMPNEGKIYKDLRFEDIAVFSVLCCASDAKVLDDKTYFPVKNVWKVLTQSERWNNVKNKGAFEENLKMSIDRLNEYIMGEGKWFVTITDKGIIMKVKPKRWIDLGKLKKTIPSDMLSCRSRLDWCTQLYVARRVMISLLPNYVPVINLTTLHNETTPLATGKMVLGYLKELEKLHIIINPRLDKNRVSWINMENR